MDESEYLESLFKKAGWHEGRSIEFNVSVQSKNAAEGHGIEILREFGGLNVEVSGAGRECPAGNVRFLWEPSEDLHRTVFGWEPTV